MKIKRKNGFTLIEVIVVIAIIGILSAILIPSLMGYVAKAKKQSDREAAATIGRTTMAVAVSGDPEMKTTYYSSKASYSVTVDNNDSTESYTLNVACKSENGKWVAIEDSVQPFVDRINGNEYFTGTQSTLVVRYSGGIKSANCWIMAFNPDVQDSVEIWTALSTDSGCVPAYRVWPDPDVEYT